MISSRLTRIAIRMFLTLAVPFILVMGNSRLLLSYQFLEFEYQRAGFPNDFYGFTTADRLEYGPSALDYLFNGEPIDFLTNMRLPGEKCWQLAVDTGDCALFSDRELHHMQDVKQFTGIAFGLALPSAAIAFGILALVWRSGQGSADIVAGTRRGSTLTLALIVTMAVLALTAWDGAFDRFHEIFFAEGTWRFPFSDTLIRLYPEQLFVDASLAIACLAALGALLILILLSIWEKLSA